jgi:pyridoxamine 5'-phosphate oxidase family protein
MSCPCRFATTRTRTRSTLAAMAFAQRKKYRDVQRNPRVAIVIDDLATVDPWRPRMIEIRGQADILPTGGEAIGPGFDPPIFRIRPRRIVSIGINGDQPFSSNARSVS